MVIRTLFDIQRQSSPMARGDKTWSSAPLQSEDNKVWWDAETNHEHAHRFCYPKTIKSVGTWRQNMVIHTLFAIQRQSSLMARRDKTWSSTPFLLSRDNQVWWHTETKHGYSHPLCYPETIKSNGTWRQNRVIHPVFAIQRQSSPMAHGDKHCYPHPFFLSRDNQVRWHVETKHGNPNPFCYPETIKSDATQRQIMVIRTLFLSRDNQVWWHAKTKQGHSHPLCYLETIKCDDTRRQNRVI